MIEKLDIELTQAVATNRCIINKVNQLVDAVNEIMTWRFDCDDETRAENVQP